MNTDSGCLKMELEFWEKMMDCGRLSKSQCATEVQMKTKEESDRLAALREAKLVELEPVLAELHKLWPVMGWEIGGFHGESFVFGSVATVTVNVFIDNRQHHKISALLRIDVGDTHVILSSLWFSGVGLMVEVLKERLRGVVRDLSWALTDEVFEKTEA